MATLHIAAEPGDFAPAVLMPGNPKRAQRIAKLLMDDARLITDIRRMLGFTGTMNGRPLSTMGSGARQPSSTVCATELFSQFEVKRVIRVGTTDALSPKAKVDDVIVTTGTHTGSSMNRLRIPGVSSNTVADFRLALAVYQASQLEGAQAGGAVHPGAVMSRNHFYFTPRGQTEALASCRVLGVEIEAIALYKVAAEYDKQALAILTVSDRLLDHSSDMGATERETRLTDSLRPAVTAAHNWLAHGLRACRSVRTARATATPLRRGGYSSPRP